MKRNWRNGFHPALSPLPQLLHLTDKWGGHWVHVQRLGVPIYCVAVAGCSSLLCHRRVRPRSRLVSRSRLWWGRVWNILTWMIDSEELYRTELGSDLTRTWKGIACNFDSLRCCARLNDFRGACLPAISLSLFLSARARTRACVYVCVCVCVCNYTTSFQLLFDLQCCACI